MNDEEAQVRIRKAQEKFEQNYLEFKRKKLAETPCFRSTFLTSKPKFLNGLNNFTMIVGVKFI